MTDIRELFTASLGSVYRIDRELGGGGMSRVFLAEELALGRLVVIKVLPEELTGAVSSERFRREMQLAAKLQHPHIVPVLSSGEVDRIPYYTMPFIEGESLRSRIRRDGELPVDLAVRIARHVASAMSYAHKHGIVHRDIKPDNVILSDEFAVVTDFGVAKALSVAATGDESHDDFGSLTSVGMAIGTPAYMSPEQALGEPTVDHRADIYALGAMTYEMLCGVPPFTAKSAQGLIAAHAIETPVAIESRRPGMPPALAATVMRSLQKRPADRPQSATEFLQAIDSTVTSGSIAFTPPAQPAQPKRSRLIFGSLVLVIIAAFAYGLLAPKFKGRTATAAGPTSVAVLPLVNVGGDNRDEYFSEGMTDELANALARVAGLRVASRTSTYAFKGRRDVKPSDIGRQLNVDAILEGTVRRDGQRLRVQAQLTSASDGLSLWSDSYERQTSDVFEVQDDIAQSIANALRERLGANTAAATAAPAHGTEDLVAYDLYLRGRYFWYRRGADNLRRSIDYLEQSVARDPRYARAWSALAMSYTLLPEYTDSPPADAVEKARSASVKAIALDSTLAEAHTALGLTAVHAWEFETAGREYRKALELEPRNPTANQWYGELLYHTAKVDSAIARIREAKALDPLAPIASAALGYALILGRRYKEAIDELNKGIELAPTLGLHRALIAHAYLLAGDNANAVREIEAATRLDPELLSRKGELAYIYGKAGRTADAARITADLEQRAANISPVALVYAYLGTRDFDRAFDALDRAVAIHDLSLGTNFSLTGDPIFDPIRQDPRFQRILERMHLSQYMRNR